MSSNPDHGVSISLHYDQSNAVLDLSIQWRIWARLAVMGDAMVTSTDDVLKRKYPAKAHAKRVAQYLEDKGLPKDAVIYLEAAHTHMKEDNDEAAPFRQRRYFYYLSGCNLPDSYLTYNIPQDVLTLFIPPVNPDSVIWAGLPLGTEQAMRKYDVDDVKTSDHLNAALAAYGGNRKNTTVFAIPEQVSEHVTFLGFAKADLGIENLKTAIEECRVVKDEYEIAMLRKANEVSTLAHNAVVRAVQSGEATNEREIWATFVGTCMWHGAMEQSYHSIAASGTSCATLHYVHNDAPLTGKLNILLDAGGEWACYCADITRTFPISGEWTKESKEIYDLVDEMQSECFKMLKEGVMWEDVHERAHWVAIRGLLKLGILKGDEREIFEKRVSVAFFPHGLGHYLGMDTHDTGGHANYEDKDTMFRYLRVRGKLPAGCCITVEPGLYFCNFIIDPVLEDENLSKYIDKDVLDRYWTVGGVRIEDDVIITKNGYDNLTDTPKL